jgi:protein SCO1
VPLSPAIGGRFELTAHDGHPMTERDFLGRPFLVFFGYTHCLDICHATLFELSEILRAMGPQAKIGVAFVTVDPERDRPEVLRDYLGNFDPRIVGLSGGLSAIESALREYRVYAKNVASDVRDDSVDHTTIIYLMDKSGHFVSSFNIARRPAAAARELERYL